MTTSQLITGLCSYLSTQFRSSKTFALGVKRDGRSYRGRIIFPLWVQRQTKNDGALKLLCECLEIDAGSSEGIEEKYKNGFVTLSDEPGTITQYAFKPITATSIEFDPNSLEWIDFSFNGSGSTHLVLAAKIGSDWLEEDADDDNEILHEVTLVRDLKRSLDRKKHIKEFDSDIDSETEDGRVVERKKKKKIEADEAEIARIKTVQAELSTALARLNAEHDERTNTATSGTTATDRVDPQPKQNAALNQGRNEEKRAAKGDPAKVPYYTSPQYQNDAKRGRRNQNRRGSFRGRGRGNYYDSRNDSTGYERNGSRRDRYSSDSRSPARNDDRRGRSRSPRRRGGHDNSPAQHNKTAAVTSTTAGPIGHPPAQGINPAQTNALSLNPYGPHPPPYQQGPWGPWNQPTPGWTNGWGSFNPSQNNWPSPGYGPMMPQQWQSPPGSQHWNLPPNVRGGATLGPQQPTAPMPTHTSTAVQGNCEPPQWNVTAPGPFAGPSGSENLHTSDTGSAHHPAQSWPQQPQPNMTTSGTTGNQNYQSTPAPAPTTHSGFGGGGLPQRSQYQQNTAQRDAARGQLPLPTPTGPPPPLGPQNPAASGPKQHGVAVNAYQAAWQHYYNGANPQPQQQPGNGEAQ